MVHACRPRYRRKALPVALPPPKRPKLQTFWFERYLFFFNHCAADFTLKAVFSLRSSRGFVLYDPQNPQEPTF
jgi:hypothetical protein